MYNSALKCVGLSYFGVYKTIFRKRAAFVLNAPGIHFGKMIFAKTRFALPVSKSWSHILLSLKTIKIKVKLNHKIKPSTFESMPHLKFKSNCVIGKLTGTCLASLQFH